MYFESNFFILLQIYLLLAVNGIFTNEVREIVEVNEISLLEHLEINCSCFLSENTTAIAHDANSSHCNCSNYHLVKFYAKWCSFSQALEPVYAYLPAAFPTLDILAIDASKHSSLNSRYFSRHSNDRTN
jgi:hypothetical protein